MTDDAIHATAFQQNINRKQSIYVQIHLVTNPLLTSDKRRRLTLVMKTRQ